MERQQFSVDTALGATLQKSDIHSGIVLIFTRSSASDLFEKLVLLGSAKMADFDSVLSQLSCRFISSEIQTLNFIEKITFSIIKNPSAFDTHGGFAKMSVLGAKKTAFGSKSRVFGQNPVLGQKACFRSKKVI